MQKRGLLYLAGMGAFVLVVGLACSALSSTTAPAPSAAPAQSQAGSAPAASSSGGLVTWTDKNKYFAIDVPSDWKQSEQVDQKASHWYWDTIAAPDGHAKVESVVYDDGTAWTGSQNGAEALYLLNQFYSSTGKEGDIRISDDSMQKDGSERLTWVSKGGNYSGVSFFEVRNRTAFLMFTTYWDNDYATQYQTVLDKVVSSYRHP